MKKITFISLLLIGICSSFSTNLSITNDVVSEEISTYRNYRVDNNEATSIMVLPQNSNFDGNTICSTENGQLTLLMSAGTGPFTVTYYDGVANRTQTNVISGTPFNVFSNPSTTTTYTLVSIEDSLNQVRNSGFTVSSATITLNNSPIGGSIVGSTTVCAGFNNSSLNLSGSFGTVSKWQYSDVADFSSGIVDVSNTSNALNVTNISETRYYRAVFSNGVCSVVYSAVAAITVTQNPIGGTISGGTTVCDGTNNTTLTLDGSFGTVTKWQYSTVATFASGVVDISNTTTTLNVTNLNETRYYRAILSNGVCPTVNSGNATVTVNENPIGGSILGDTTVCAGINNSTLILTGSFGSVIKWQYSDVATFASGIVDVSNTTTTLNVTNISATRYYRAVLSNGACPTVNSSVAIITVNENPIGGTISGSTTVCDGTNNTTLTLTGSFGTVTKWQYSTFASFASGIVDISNTTTALNVTNITETRYYRAVLSNGICPAVNSSVATITVATNAVGGSLSGDATVCAGTNNSTLTLTGSVGSIIKWQYSDVNTFATGVVDVNNTTTTLTATNLGATRYYRVVLSNGVCPTINSSIATITVTANPLGGTISGGTSVCAGTNNITLNLSGSLGTVTKWQYSNVVTFASGVVDVPNTTTTLNVTNISATRYYRAVLSNGVCPTVNSSVATITVNPLTTTGSGTVTACDSYFWSQNGQTYTSSGVYTNTVGCNTATLNLTITPSITPAVVLTSSDIDNLFNYGTPITFTATASNLGSGTAIYTFSINGTIVQSSASSTFDSSNIENNQQVSVSIVVSNGACLTTNVATSNIITNTVTGAVLANLIYNPGECGTVVSTINYTFYSSTPNVGSNTLSYRFMLKNNVTNATIFVDRTEPNVNLLLTSFIAYNTSFTARVAAVVNGIVQPYSPPCSVTTPNFPLNQVVTSQCGITLAAINTKINVTTVVGAQLYRFKVALNSNPSIFEEIESPFPNFRLTSLLSVELNYSRTYQISVQSDILNNGILSTTPYGSFCLVTTPPITTVVLQPNQCGSTLSEIDSRIFVNSIPKATGYIYRVSLASNPAIFEDIVYPHANFRLTFLTTVPLLYQENYNIAVSVRVTVDGIDFYSGFGPSCIYRTPDFPISQIIASQCGGSTFYLVANRTTKLYADVNFATAYRFTLQQYDNATLTYSQMITTTENNFDLSMFTGLQPNTIYNVSVALNYYGSGPTGKDCTIKTPMSVTARLIEKPFTVTAYPNPFENSFKIFIETASETPLSIKVYDMIGRLVEERTTKISDIETLAVGENLPTGVYNVIATQENENSTFRMIKR